MNELTTIEKTLNDNGRVSARNLYEFLEMDLSNFSRWSKTNIIDNEFAELGIDFVQLVIHDETPTGGLINRVDYSLSVSFAKKLCMLSKTQKGEEARNYFIKVEEKLKQVALNMSQLSPQMQVLINLELEQSKLKQEISEVKSTLYLVKDTVANHPEDNWRETINKMFNRIVTAVGHDKYQELRNESYKLLESRAACDIDTRLRNFRKRLTEAGETKTKINKSNKLDVIEQDSRLKEIYTGIIKELTIKHVA